MPQKIPAEVISKIKDEVTKGKTKRQIAEEFGVSEATVIAYTKGRSNRTFVPDELKERIRREVGAGKQKTQVATELSVPYHTVMFYTKDMPTKKWRSCSNEMVEKIRAEVKKQKTKSEVAKELGVSYDIVKYHTRDIPIKKIITIPEQLIRQIRENVINGKSMYAISKDLKISLHTVRKYTSDLSTHSEGWSGIRGRTLKILRELLKQGYAFLPASKPFNGYKTLRKYFPTVRKVRLFRTSLLFLEDKEKEAMQAFMERMKKKKNLTNREFYQIARVFIPSFTSRKKRRIIKKCKIQGSFLNDPSKHNSMQSKLDEY